MRAGQGLKVDREQIGRHDSQSTRHRHVSGEGQEALGRLPRGVRDQDCEPVRWKVKASPSRHVEGIRDRGQAKTRLGDHDRHG